MKKRNIIVAIALTAGMLMTACASQNSSKVTEGSAEAATKATTEAASTEATTTETATTEAPTNTPPSIQTLSFDSSYSFLTHGDTLLAYRMNGDVFEITSYDQDGKQTGTNSMYLEPTQPWSYSFFPLDYDAASVLLTYGYQEQENFTFVVLDLECKELMAGDFNAPRMNDYYVLRMDDSSENTFYIAANSERDFVFAKVDLDNGEVQDFFDASEGGEAESGTTAYAHIALPESTPEEEYDTSRWSYHNYDESVNLYLVATVDRSSWGYADLDGNELAMFADASDFNKAGYAMISDDREGYRIINSEMNSVNDEVYIGCSAYLTSMGSNWLVLKAEDGSFTLFYIK